MDEPAPLYDVVSVVNHEGTMSGGHYTAFARKAAGEAGKGAGAGGAGKGAGGESRDGSGSDDRTDDSLSSWLSFNDTIVKPLNEDEDACTSNAYLLVCRRRGDGQ